MTKRKVQIMGSQLSVRTDAYSVNGALAVSLVTESGEPFCSLSINVPDVELAEGEFVSKNYSEMENVYPSVLQAGVIEDTGRRVLVGGLISAPVCKLPPE